MDNFSTVMVAFLTGVLGPISIMFIKHYLDSKKKKKSLSSIDKVPAVTSACGKPSEYKVLIGM